MFRLLFRILKFCFLAVVVLVGTGGVLAFQDKYFMTGSNDDATVVATSSNALAKIEAPVLELESTKPSTAKSNKTTSLKTKAPQTKTTEKTVTEPEKSWLDRKLEPLYKWLGEVIVNILTLLWIVFLLWGFASCGDSIYIEKR